MEEMMDQGPEKENALIVNALFVQNVRGKSILIIQCRRTMPWQEERFLLIHFR